MNQAFIVGAPKCGTTSLAAWLSEHPQVLMSQPKEPHYFSDDLNNRNITKECEYLQLFEHFNSESHRVCMEASTWYFYSKVAVANIEKLTGGVARYIVMTRDPVEMAESLYYHNLRHSHENVDSFEQAWNLQELRRRGECIPRHCREPAFLQYHEACSLGSRINALRSAVAGDRIFHIPLASIKSDPVHVYRSVLQFLNLEWDGRQQFPVLNESVVVRVNAFRFVYPFASALKRMLGIRKGLGLMKMNEKPRVRQPINSSFRGRLESDFEHERALISALPFGCMN